MDYRGETSDILREFLTYHETIRGHSSKTIDEYFLDLRRFFRWLKLQRNLVSNMIPFDQIPISDVDVELLKSVSLSDIYSFLSYLSRDCHLTAASRARKIAAIRSLYKYLTSKAKLIDENPIQDLDSPKLQRSLPQYLSLDESLSLLQAIDGKNYQRDYCIITLFLNCGLRISELVGLDLTDLHTDHLRILGKGNKVRIVYLNDACVQAINDYLLIRKGITAIEPKAFFLSSRRGRMSRAAVHKLVKKHLLAAGLDAEHLSAHKLRHTAATLMLKGGVDVRTLQEILGHEHLNTTQIYTHVEADEMRQAVLSTPLAKVKKQNTVNSK